MSQCWVWNSPQKLGTKLSQTRFTDPFSRLGCIYPSAIQWVYKAPLFITLRIKTWVVAYFDPKWNASQINKKKSFMLCNFLLRTPQHFIFLSTKSWKKNTLKIAQKFSNCIFSLKFIYSEKATKFEKIFHLKFDATQ